MATAFLLQTHLTIRVDPWTISFYHIPTSLSAPSAGVVLPCDDTLASGNLRLFPVLRPLSSNTSCTSSISTLARTICVLKTCILVLSPWTWYPLPIIYSMDTVLSTSSMQTFYNVHTFPIPSRTSTSGWPLQTVVLPAWCSRRMNTGAAS